MVRIHDAIRNRSKVQYITSKGRIFLSVIVSAILVILFYVSTLPMDEVSSSILHSSENHQCDYKSISDLKQYELYPMSSVLPDGNNRRHMVNPPVDTRITLVCCETTAGQLSIAVHHSWAPIGSNHFLEMVSSKYFMSVVPFMRCIHNFICQFGISGNLDLNKRFASSIQDDPNWLPEGPDYRINKDGVKRFARGYLAYAGSGKNSRGNQLIVSLNDNPRLGGGSPWEVPFGELVGDESYSTLSKISTEYGENGPSQSRLRKPWYAEQLKIDFPSLDYITSCVIVDNKIMNE